VLLAASVLGLVTWLGWWLASTHTPVWIRHPSPGLFTFVPVLAAFVVLALRVLARERQAWTRIVSLVGAAALTALLALQAGAYVGEPRGHAGETLADQRRAAEAIEGVHEGRLAGVWGGTVSVTVMSGAHAALVDAPRVENVTRIWSARALGRAEFDEWLRTECGSERVATGRYVVCEAPPVR
jgi:hypothetical protein